MGIPQHVLDAAEQADADLDNWVNGDDTGSGDTDPGDGEGLELESAIDFEDFSGDTGSEFQSGNGDGSDDPNGFHPQNDDGVNWQHRAQVAEGRLKVLGPQVAQIPQLQQQVAQLQQNSGGDVQALVQAALAEERAKQAQEARQLQLRGQLADEFGLGDEGVDAISQYIDARIPQPSQSQGQLPPSQASTPVVEKSAQDFYQAAVFAAHPNFEQVNNDPGFHSWLQGADTDGISRSAKLGQAHASLNSSVVIGLINQYLISAGQRGQQQSQRQSAIQRQLAPSRSHGGAGQPQQQQQYLTPQQIQVFYDRHNRGEFRGKEGQWAKINALIETSERHHFSQG